MLFASAGHLYGALAVLAVGVVIYLIWRFWPNPNVCPKCGGEPRGSIKRGTTITYTCENCKHMWTEIVDGDKKTPT